MVKRWLTPPVWQTRISPGIFLKIQHVYGQKMIDPPEWQTRISPRIFFKDSLCVWSKDDWYDNQDLHLEFFKDSTCAHGQKMIDPQYDKPGSHHFF